MDKPIIPYRQGTSPFDPLPRPEPGSTGEWPRLAGKIVRGAIAAWRNAGRPGRLLILAERDGRLLQDHDDTGVQWVGPSSEPKVLFAAADQVIAYGTFTTMSTLARNAVPTVAIVGEANPVDGLHASFFHRSGLLEALSEDFDPDHLWDTLTTLRTARDELSQASVGLRWGDPDDIARHLLKQTQGGSKGD